MMAYPIFRRVVGLVGLPAAILFTLSIFTLSIGAQGARLPQRMALGNAPRANAPAASKARVSGERAGQVVTRDGLKLMLTADTGNVQVSSDAVGAVRYQVRIEADANDPAAQGLCKEFVLTARGTPQGVTLVGQMPNSRDAERVWVTYEVHVPRRYSVEIATRAGDVTTQDIAGTATLSSGAGNIQAGRIGDVQAMKSAAMPTSTGAAEHGTFVARLQTAGGHISLGDVGGGLRAMTGGGHIDAGNIYGDAVLQSGGGNLRAGHIAGAARLITGGGNIAVERVEAGVEAEWAAALSLAKSPAGFTRARGVAECASRACPARCSLTCAMAELCWRAWKHRCTPRRPQEASRPRFRSALAARRMQAMVRSYRRGAEILWFTCPGRSG